MATPARDRGRLRGPPISGAIRRLWARRLGAPRPSSGQPSTVPRAAFLFVAATALAAGIIGFAALARTAAPSRGDALLALVLGALVAVAWLFPLPFSFKWRLYLDTCVLVAAILLLEPGLAIAIAGAGTAAAHLVRRDDPLQGVFNSAQTMLQTGAGAAVVVGGGWRPGETPFDSPSLLLVVPAGALMWFVTSASVATVVGLQSSVAPWRVLVQGFWQSGPADVLAQAAQVGLGVMAAVLAAAQPWTLALLVLPAAAVYRSLADNHELRRRAEQALRDSEAALAEAQRIAHLGSWEWHLGSGDHVWSGELYRLLGVEPDAVEPTYRSFVGHVHPGDRALVDGTVHQALYEGRPFSVDHRIRRANGDELYVHHQGEVVFEEGSKARVVGTILDVTERRQLEQARDTLLATVSHDLKNPLTVIQGQAQLLQHRLKRGGADDQPWLASGLASIDVSTRRMTAQIEELVDVARLQMGQELELQRGTVDLVALARERAASYQGSTTRHAIRVQTTETAVVGTWDRRRLERVVDNLLGNAVKYSPEGGEIRLRVGREVRDRVEWAELAVEDEGIGIPKADLPHLGQRHRRGGNVAGIPGTGVGLAGARQIVAQHGGSIRVTSEESRGSVFTVSLPLTG